MSIFDLASWIFQLYLAFFFTRSAYRKIKNFQHVSAEFRDWGYPFPGFVTGFLVFVWTICAATILTRSFAGLAAVALLGFMVVAFATLLVNGEIRRLIEPTRLILLLIVVIAVRYEELTAITF